MESNARNQRMEQLLGLAEESRSVLFELGSLLNQRYRDRGPSHQTQQSLRRKNAVISRLDQFITDQQRSSTVEDRATQDQKATIERLEKQLEDQKVALEQERASLQQQVTQNSAAQAELRSSLDRMLPQLRGLLAAYDREEGNHVDQTHITARTVTITGDVATNQDLSRRLTELQSAFDKERTQLMKRATDAANTHQAISRKNLTEREAVLTCPISLDLFENPVVTTCCGKTFSSGALSQALSRNPQCPVCRSYSVGTHANRDVASLVEIHRTERSILGFQDNTVAGSNVAVATISVAPAAIRPADVDRATTASNAPRELTGYGARENANRNLRNQRVQERNAVPHRQPQAAGTTAPAVSNTPSSSSARGRRGGRGSSRQRQTSHSSSSTASSGYSASASTPVWQRTEPTAAPTYEQNVGGYYGYAGYGGYGLRSYGRTGYYDSDSDY